MRETLDPAVQEVGGGQAPPMEEPEVFEVYFEAAAP